MAMVDIISGFLGAGKTTLIKKLLCEAYAGEKVILIENEFGEIGIDGGFMRDTGITVTEINSGCICCTLASNFKSTLGPHHHHALGQPKRGTDTGEHGGRSALFRSADGGNPGRARSFSRRLRPPRP